jgi:hypothetical protein
MKSHSPKSFANSTKAYSQTPHVIVSPTSATILASYNCSAACQHCCFDSHPGIQTRLSLREILRFIDEASILKTLKLVVFSGGECFLLGNDLDIAIKYATDKGLATRCVTNGYWAISEDRALRRLQEVKNAGLKEINFSTGDFHQKFVPQQNIINGVLASTKLDMMTVVMVELQKERQVIGNSLANDPKISQLLSSLSKDGKLLLQIIESHWMPMSLEEEVKQNQEMYASKYNIHKKQGCRDILNNIVATPTGKLGVCCGLSRDLIPELNLDITEGKSISDIYKEAATDFMKIWLFVEGPEKILAWAGIKDPEIRWENKYAHHCHACLALYKDDKVRKVLRKYYYEKVEEVLLKYSTMIRAGNISTCNISMKAACDETVSY